ncbi:DHA2 family efflux MFS transporter permease subunit [Sphingobium sufflavum]|uniref:DHA2 family efflux MFS transporter permease subunit n=1 Tax=Sphingobium sufflavum TaxID=1129547 RepID=UPI001F15C2D0|nr:DHA2 family efflux MFS transporter permease subunit [Sphingobium sufflavum]MCE7796900.1 DHA2 family efflux MFS transporter permease subunit [Sphingobium sufflavum]
MSASTPADSAAARAGRGDGESRSGGAGGGRDASDSLTPAMGSEAGDRAVLPSRHPELLTWAVMAISICQFIDATIANVALPHMQTSLDASIENVSWVLTSFIIASAIATPITGWLSDRIGSRILFLLSCGGFLLTSGLCGLATSLPAMVVFRIFQGVCAAFMGPMSQTIMYDINRPSRQPRAVAIWGVVVMIAPISGPFLGGLLTDQLNWRWVFFVNLPIGIPALALIWWLLPSRPIERRRLDLFGFGMLAVALGALQLLLDRGHGRDWLESREIMVEMCVAISCFWIFLIHSRQTAKPLFKGSLFHDSNFIASLVLMAALGLSNVGLSAMLPTMYQTVYGYGVMDTGMLMAPRGVGVVVTMILTNHLMKRLDYRYIAVFGFCVTAFSMWTMTRWSLDQSSREIIVSGFIQGLGLGFVFVPMNMIGFSRLSVENRMEGSAIMALARNLGASFGISVIVTMLARNIQVSHADLVGGITPFSLPGVDISAMAERLGTTGGAILGMVDGLVNRQAMMIAYLDNFTLMFWLLLALAPLPLIAKRPPRLGDAPDAPHMAME